MVGLNSLPSGQEILTKRSLTLLGWHCSQRSLLEVGAAGLAALLRPVGLGGDEEFLGVVLRPAFTAHRVPAKQQRGMAAGSSCSRETARPRAALYEGLLLAGAGYGISVYQPKQHAKPM